MTTIYEQIDLLIQQATLEGLIEARDMMYVRNQVMHLLELETFTQSKPSNKTETIPVILENIIAYAIEANVIEDVFDDKEMLTANIMNCFMPRPSDIEKKFYEKYAILPKLATDYFYHLSQTSNYIQTKRIAQNVHFKHDSAYGKLDITINLSKPEKDPEQIRREKEMPKPKTTYPPCVLCVENEGYAGRTGYAARANHRMIKMNIAAEPWYFQYSPYVYYNEHSILLSEEHRDMVINEKTFERLIAFVDAYPHYFIGSNADLPIVGGSILSHDHYQAGNYTFAMTNAAKLRDITIHGHEDVDAAILKWPLSVIRLSSKNKSNIIRAASSIFDFWKSYTDLSVDIAAFSGDVRHNTITPIARKRGAHFELDLVLRNNRTTDEAPDGLFHPRADVHHIKKENIGLIEVMGLAVLPARLKEELAVIEASLRGDAALNDVAAYHRSWTSELIAANGTMNSASAAREIVEAALTNKFARVLEDAGVFKQTEDGIAAFQRFIDSM